MSRIISPLLLGVQLAVAHRLHSGSWCSGSHLAFAQFPPWEEQRAAPLPGLHSRFWWHSWREGAGERPPAPLALVWPLAQRLVNETGKQLRLVLCPGFIMCENKDGCTKLCVTNSNASTLWLYLCWSYGFRGTNLMCSLSPNSVVLKKKDSVILFWLM